MATLESAPPVSRALPDEEREWLKKLEVDLWPKDHKNGVVSLEASRQLTLQEFKRLTRILKSGSVVVEMICTNMFGGYGICIYEHEPYPHTGAQYLACVIEDHMPPRNGIVDPDRHGKLSEPGHVAGSGSTRAWNYFSKYTHTEEMKAWCKKYKLRKPEERYHYDY